MNIRKWCSETFPIWPRPCCCSPLEWRSSMSRRGVDRDNCRCHPNWILWPRSSSRETDLRWVSHVSRWREYFSWELYYRGLCCHSRSECEWARRDRRVTPRDTYEISCHASSSSISLILYLCEWIMSLSRKNANCYKDIPRKTPRHRVWWTPPVRCCDEMGYLWNEDKMTMKIHMNS